MYDVSVSTSFVAQHYLIGGDFGAENIKHSHNFKIQLIIENDILNTHNYVVDIDDIKNFLTKIEKTYKDQCLNAQSGAQITQITRPRLPRLSRFLFGLHRAIPRFLYQICV